MGPSATESEPPAAPAAAREARARRTSLLPLLCLSIALHAAAAMGLAFLLARHFTAKPDDTLDLGIDVTLGDAVQELVVTQPSTEPPEPVPPPPTPPPPTPEPPPPEPVPEPPPPPPAEKPEFVEPKPVAPPKPPAKAAARGTPVKPAAAPPGAKVGPVARAGVVGGNVTQGKTTGTPGGQKVGTEGWRTPKPPYPPAALVSRIQGSGEIRITTDAAGNVRDAVVTRPIASLLDANTRQFALANWKGPPNSTRTVPVTYYIP